MLHQSSKTVYQDPDTAMLFINAQTMAFFKNITQMCILHVTVIKLAKEGIANVSDMSKFYDTTIKIIEDNLKRPGGQVTDSNDASVNIPAPLLYLVRSWNTD